MPHCSVTFKLWAGQRKISCQGLGCGKKNHSHYNLYYSSRLQKAPPLFDGIILLFHAPCLSHTHGPGVHSPRPSQQGCISVEHPFVFPTIRKGVRFSTIALSGGPFSRRQEYTECHFFSVYQQHIFFILFSSIIPPVVWPMLCPLYTSGSRTLHKFLLIRTPVNNRNEAVIL